MANHYLEFSEVFVTASQIQWNNAYDFVDRSKRQFLSNSRSESCDEKPC